MKLHIFIYPYVRQLLRGPKCTSTKINFCELAESFSHGDEVLCICQNKGQLMLQNLPDFLQLTI